MSLGIQQMASYARDGRWNWSVWIDGPDAELDQVEWVLHPTFPNPVVLVMQRQTKFRIDRNGWEKFEINANVTAKDGHRQHLKRWGLLGGSGTRPARRHLKKDRQSSSLPASRTSGGSTPFTRRASAAAFAC